MDSSTHRIARQYRSPRHNGATIVRDRNQWIARLESCVSNYQDLDELILVSNTSQKLLQLIVPALERGLLVKVYTRHPKQHLSARDTEIATSLEERLDDEILGRLGPGYTGKVELRYFRQAPTFRAVLIGKAVLGFQAYTVRANNQAAIAAHSAADSENRMDQPPAPSDLRLIVTRHSEHFDSLREMVNRFLRFAGTDTDPYAVRESQDLHA